MLVPSCRPTSFSQANGTAPCEIEEISDGLMLAVTGRLEAPRTRDEAHGAGARQLNLALTAHPALPRFLRAGTWDVPRGSLLLLG